MESLCCEWLKPSLGFHVVLLVSRLLLVLHNITGYITGHTFGENRERNSTEESIA